MTAPAKDSVVPLVSSAQFAATAYSDLTKNLQGTEIDDIMIEATRACESIVGKRLAQFTITETHRAEGVDPEEYGSSSIPLDLQGTTGRSYASALGSGDLVRQMWLSSFAVRYQEFWTPYTVNSMTLVRSYGGSQSVVPNALIGPEPDSGHVWFQIGTFLPIGSLIRVNYSGGYGTCPGDLARAVKAMAASIVIKELDPDIGSTHDPDLLRDEAIEFLGPYMTE
jgi:hypothetical protein